MESRLERWVLVWIPVACGGVAWFVAERMSLEVLAGISVAGWVMALGGRFAVREEQSTVLFRTSIYVGAAWAGVGVVEQFVALWAVSLPAEPWRMLLAAPVAVARWHREMEGAIVGFTPWVAVSMTAVALYLALSVTVEGVSRMGWMRAWKWPGSSAVPEKQWAVAWVPVAFGAAVWFFGERISVELLMGVSVLSCAMVVGTWLAVPEERATALLRMSVYAGGAWMGLGVLQEFWAMWSAHLPANPWKAALAFPGAVAEVQQRLGGVLVLTPWIALAATIFGGFFGLGVGAGVLLGKGDRQEGRRESGSELFGKSRLMGRRMMQRMSRDGGIILGAIAKGLKALVVSYPLEGAKLTFSGPRTGKTSGIAANLLAVDGKGYVDGSTMIIDPRGELFFVTAERRKALGRNVVLVDPFGEVKKLAEVFEGVVRVPTTETATFNPLDFIRDGNEGVSDIRALLEGLLTPPARQGADNARHFYESAKATMSGVVAYVHWMGRDAGERAFPLRTVRTFLTASDTNEGLMRKDVEKDPTIGWGLPLDAIQRMDKVGQAEGGSNYTTIANQCDWLQVPELDTSTQTSTFDPMVMAEGNTDLFVVVPEEKLEASTAWLRMWVVTVNAVASRKLDHAGITIVIDEAPRLGYLKPVMDSFYMASGKGIRYEVFSQSKSAMDAVWQRENTEIMMDLAEVLQILDFPRANPEFADRVSKMIGHATYENVSRSEQGTVAGGDVLQREQSLQSGTNLGLVKERLIPPEDLMMLGADEQIVLTNSKVAGRQAMKLLRVRYWERADMKHLAAPNPYVLRKEAERKAA